MSRKSIHHALLNAQDQAEEDVVNSFILPVAGVSSISGSVPRIPTTRRLNTTIK